MTHAQRCAAGSGGWSALGSAGTDFYADLQLSPLLRQVIDHSGRLLDGAAGSISLIGADRTRYTKAAERGASCRLGQTFPLDEGVTGRVVACRAPVVLRSYRDLSAGHLPADHPVGDGAVAAVPIWWRGDVMGVNVVFAGRRRQFSAAEVDVLDTITQSAAAAIVAAATYPGPGQGPLPLPGPVPVQVVAAPRERTGERSTLTPRELEVLVLMSAGYGDRQVARAMGISVKTVEKHVGAVLRKTGSPNRTAAVVHALGRGWLPSGHPG